MEFEIKRPDARRFRRRVAVILMLALLFLMLPMPAMAEADTPVQTTIDAAQPAAPVQTMVETAQPAAPVQTPTDNPATETDAHTASDTDVTAAEAHVEGGLLYEIIGDGAKITGYTATATNITIPATLGGKPVTAIADYAFMNCDKMADDIVLPDTLTDAGNYAFQGTNIRNLIISDGVTEIGYSAFLGCSSLVSVSIPETVVSCGDYAFHSCLALETVNLAEGLTMLGNGMFIRTGITTLRLPSTMQSIGNSAWADCAQLASITVADGSPYFSSVDGVLYDAAKTEIISVPCAKSGSFIIPATVLEIGDSAFQNCTQLTAVTIPGSVRRVGAFAFFGCTELRTAEIQPGVTELGARMFEGCTSLESVSIPGSVVSSGNWVFWDCSNLETVDLAEGLTALGYEMFKNTGITTLHLPSTLRSTGNSAWADCAQLASITVADGNPYFSSEDGILYDAAKTQILYCPRALEGSHVIPATVWEVGGSAFQYCTQLTAVTIPGSVFNIGDSAFEGCTGLRTAQILSGLQVIGSSAFQNCTQLTAVTIPDSVRSIGSSAFEGCTALRTAQIQPGVTEINWNAFSGCTTLESVSIPGTVVTCGNSIFSGCTALTSATIHEGVTSIGHQTFLDCTSLDNLTIPSSMKKIGMRAFSGCTALETVNMSFGVSSIEQETFQGCALQDITLPASIEYVGDSAFSDCGSLTTATFTGDAPERFDADVFANAASGFKIRYPEGSSCWTTPTWNGYATESYIPTPVPGVPTAITLDRTTLDIKEGQTRTLTATLTPATATETRVSWWSSDPYIVSVDGSGKLTATGIGSATITATTVNGKKASCAVTVAENPVTGLAFDKQSVTLRAGEALELKVSPVPGDAPLTMAMLDYDSNNWDIACVHGANKSMTIRVTAGNFAGTAMVEVSLRSDSSVVGRCDVTVVAAPLPTPQQLGWVDTDPKIATWGDASSWDYPNCSYSVQLYRDGVAVGEPVSTVNNWYDFASQIQDEGIYTFKVTAIGNGHMGANHTYLDSAPSAMSPGLNLHTDPITDPGKPEVEGIFPGQSITPGADVSFGVTGAGMDNLLPVEGDIRLLPVSWSTNPSGTFSGPPYTAEFNTASMTLGRHTLTVTLREQVYRNYRWVYTGVTTTESVGYYIGSAPQPAWGGYSDNPATGDGANVPLWICSALVAAGIFAVCAVMYGRDKRGCGGK